MKVKNLHVFEAIKERRSIRAYSNKMVPEKAVEKLIEAARWAPSAGNTQPLELVTVKEIEVKRKLSDAALNQTFIQTAPVVIVVCANLNRSISAYGDRGKSLYSIQDTAAATQNILLAAHEMGLATCWVGAFREDEVRKVVNAPKGVKPVAIIPIGYAAEKSGVPQKRHIGNLIHYEKF